MPISEEGRKRIIESNKTRGYSEATRNKIRQSVKLLWTDPEYRRIHSRVGNMPSGPDHYWYGKHLSKETIQKIREAKSGAKHPMWRGGISFEPYCPKFNNEFKERVRAFFGYQCVECGTPQNGYKLHVHHVNFNKQTCCDGTTPLFVPLCHSCHGRTQKDRPYWQQHFTEMINQYYGGKCYFTKEEMKNAPSPGSQYPGGGRHPVSGAGIASIEQS